MYLKQNFRESVILFVQVFPGISTKANSVKNLNKYIYYLSRFSMPHAPLKKLKNQEPAEPFPIFNFDELDSEDEVPNDQIDERCQTLRCGGLTAMLQKDVLT